MILGVGVDVVDLVGFSRQLEDSASCFVDGTFTPGELAVIAGRPARDKTPYFGARYAAKEAFLKAWSMARFDKPPMLGSVSLKDIEILEDPWHRPGVLLHGEVKSAFQESLGSVSVHLSLSHDGSVATAYVTLESHPNALKGGG